MINAYSELVSYNGNEWDDFLDRISLLDIFMPVIKHYEDVDVLKCVVRYIAYAYSFQSDKILLNSDWEKNKKSIFDLVMIKPEQEYYNDLVLLQNPAVVISIQKWLDYQDSDTFKQLSVLKDLRLEMQLSAVSLIKKSSGETDFDQKFKNAEYANKLKLMIKDLESELIQNDGKLKEAVKEVKAASKNNNSKRSVGSYAVRG